MSFPAGARIFEEGRHAGRFRMIRTGSVALDPHVPGRSAAVVETLSPGDLLGWSRLFPPCARHLGAEALSPVRAVEFDAARVREPCEADPVLGRAVPLEAAGVVAHRLRSARTRLLDPYGARQRSAAAGARVGRRPDDRAPPPGPPMTAAGTAGHPGRTRLFSNQWSAYCEPL